MNGKREPRLTAPSAIRIGSGSRLHFHPVAALFDVGVVVWVVGQDVFAAATDPRMLVGGGQLDGLSTDRVVVGLGAADVLAPFAVEAILAAVRLLPLLHALLADLAAGA